MAERDPIERLDEIVDAVLAGGSVPAAGGLQDLVAVVDGLRELPSEAFRERLGAELARAAARAAGGGDMTSATSGIEITQSLIPYVVAERVSDLLDFVKRAFGAVETLRTTGSAGGVHAEVRIGDSRLMMGGLPGRAGMPIALHLYVEDADAVHARAVAAGARTLHGPVDQPYGDREASVADPFGNHWYIATHRASPATGHRPPGLRAVTPYLHPRGAARLIEFLEAAFGAEATDRHLSPEGSVQHAKVRIGGEVVEMGEAHGPWQPMPGTFYLYVDDVDASYARALGAGATPVETPADQPYGERRAAVHDPFENTWYLAAPAASRGQASAP
jgi:PhnB protein